MVGAKARGPIIGGRPIGGSEFDARLGFHSFPEGVLDLGHFGDEVGQLDQLGFGVAAGDDDMQVARFVA
jgi:hypothetical protein